MLLIIDTHAWIEYFLGSKKGEAFQKLFQDDKNTFLTIECCLAEVKGWSLKNNKDFSELFKIIRSNSRIVSINGYDWIDAVAIRFEQRKSHKNFGLFDAMLLVKQHEFN